MSVRVDVAELADQVGRFGAAPYLLTSGADGRPHATHVVVEISGELIRCSAGRKTASNATDRPSVCLLWPPYEAGGFSLLVDGEARIANDSSDDALRLEIRPTAAVLHRNANPEGYQADCQPLDGRH